MPASVTQQKPVAGLPSSGLGLAAAGLAIVVAIGIGFAWSDGDRASSFDVQPAHPQVTDSRRVKAEMIAERDTTISEERRVRLVKAQTRLAPRNQASVELQEKTQQMGNEEVAGG